jgi:DNA replicative helicase MCM subunit Mcm2 (Cdc46/Mcm family)
LSIQSAKGCKSFSFQLIEDSIVCRDYQEIKIQENVQLLGVGSIPRSMPMILMDDLVDTVKAGGKQVHHAFPYDSVEILVFCFWSSKSSVTILEFVDFSRTF